MSWVAVAVGTTAVVGAGMNYKNAKDQRKALSGVNQEPYYLDPMFTEVQDKLKPFGENLLDGNIPEYFKPIGEIGGQQFEDMLGLSIRDIEQSASESLAKQGRARGGALPAVTSRAIADTSIKARFDNYMQAIAGRKYMMGEGVDILEGVRSGAIGQSEEKNDYNRRAYDREMEKMLGIGDLKDRETDAFNDIIGSIGGMSTSMLGKINTKPSTTTKDGYWNQKYLDDYFATV